MAERVEVLGLKELDRKLRALAKETDKNLLSPALRKAANVIRDQAKDNVPFDPKPDGVHVRDQIKVRRDPNPQLSGSNEIMYVKPVATKKFPVYYWRHIEFGTVKMRGRRYMTNAYDSKKRQAVTEFMQSLGKAIIRETKKINRLQK